MHQPRPSPCATVACTKFKLEAKPPSPPPWSPKGGAEEKTTWEKTGRDAPLPMSREYQMMSTTVWRGEGRGGECQSFVVVL
eukprot:scaffold129607_cov28-Tisochrysis_lutea.AAC.1